MKLCKDCKQEKNDNDFFKDPESKDGLYYICKMCKRNRKKLLIKPTYNKADITEKKCNKCKIVLDIINFCGNKRSKDGYNIICKNCRRIKDAESKANRQLIINDIDFSIIKECIECGKKKSGKKFSINIASKDKLANICIKCKPPNTWTKEKQKASEFKYYLNNKEKFREKWRKQGQSINRRIRDSQNHRISQALLGNKKNKTMEYVGCDSKYLRKWFEYQFTEDMSWDNYGDWHIDHVVPCASFDLSKDEDIYKCFNWRNLKPLIAKDNLEKGNKIIDKFIKKHNKATKKFEALYPLPT